MSVIWSLKTLKLDLTANMQLGVLKVSHVNMDIQFSIESYHEVVKCWMSVDTHGSTSENVWLISVMTNLRYAESFMIWWLNFSSCQMFRHIEPQEF
jgi:hypothetical protein